MEVNQHFLKIVIVFNFLIFIFKRYKILSIYLFLALQFFANR